MKEPRLERRREGYHWFRAWRAPSAAQRRVLDELIAGGSNAEIAARLGMTEGGVKWHLDELREELELPDRPALADWWRTRQRQSLLLPSGLIWRLGQRAIQAPVLTLPAALLVLVGLIAFGGLAAGHERGTAAQPADPRPAAAVALPPTPTPAAVAAGAVVFDVDARSVTNLPGMFTARRWLDTRSNTFVALGREGAVIVDATGQSTAIASTPESWGISGYVPLTDRGQLLLWRAESGRLSVLDTATLAATSTTDFEPSRLGDRVWAINQATGAIALTNNARSQARIHNQDGVEVASFAPPTGEAIVHLAWSPDGQRLLVLLGARLEGSRVGPSLRFLVLDAGGRQTYEGEVGVRWAGSSAVLVVEPDRLPAGGGALNGTRLVNVTTGAELPLNNATSMLCASPDSAYGVFTYEKPAGGQRFNERQELRRLATDDLIVTSRTEQRLFSCDWTPDGRRVVLSPGGK